jgi:hypothetical protein
MRMAQPLFFEPDVQFEKVAAEVMLPEDANAWPNELMQELFKQVPYVADFEPHVTMDRVDAERGYGFGHVEIQNKTEIQHGAEPEALQAAGIKSARIPIVIKDRKLQPLDLLVTADSQVMPLTEARLRQALFRPQVFDITGRGPGDMSMIGQLYPPYRQNYGFGGGGATMNVGMGKEGADKEALALSTVGSYLKKQTDPQGLAHASKSLLGRGAQQVTGGAAAVGQKKLLAGGIAAQRAAQYAAMPKAASILSAILPTINPRDFEAFFQKMADDQGLQAQYLANGHSTRAALKTLSEYTPSESRKLAAAALIQLKPSVAQLRKDDEGYSLKTAAFSCWLPEVQKLDRGQAVRLLGEKVVLAADTTGAATMTLGEGVAEPESPEADKAELVSQFGIYKVQDSQGRHLIGYVFPNLIDIDGTALPIALFTNGSQMAMQGDIAGINVGGGASLFEGKPSGMGVFYHLLPNGRAEATVPMNLKASMSSPEEGAEGEGGVVFHAETFDGRPVQVSIQPNLEAITPTPDGGMLIIPDSFSWLPLDKAEETQLVENPEGFNKEAAAARALATVQVRCGGSDSFSLSGFPVDKLASDERSFLSLDDAMFLLGGLGTNLDYAQKKLGEAAAWSAPVSIRVGSYIKLATDRLNDALEKAASVLSTMPDLKQDLFKEAAVIPDPVAVDTVLSLGFLNPENLGAFIAYMPVIDEAQLKMCELLLAARLGLQEIPVPALERAIRCTEETLEGLKVLAFQRG